MSANKEVVTFPLYYLQSDWNDIVASGKSEDIWISSKKLNEPKGKNFHLKVSKKTITLEKPIPEFEIVSFTNNRCLIIKDTSSQVTHRFLPSSKLFASIHKKSVDSLDIAPSGIAVSSNENTLKVWDTQTGQIKNELKGHFLDVNKCRFFPSHEVILTAGVDMQIKIWSAIDGQCAVTLIGHKGAVNDIAIVDKGRNIISVGRDGLVKLWSCAQKLCIEDIFDICQHDDNHGGNMSINACSIRPINDFNLGKRADSPNKLSVGTEDKLLLIGTESGFVYAIGVHSKQLLFKVKCDSAVNCVIFLKDFNFAYGTQNGLVYEADLRNPSQALCCWNFTKSPVLSMISVKRPFNGIVVGRQDGTVTFHYENHLQVAHLTGSDCDPIYDIAYDGKFIYTACRDGKVRRYLLNNAFE